MPVQFNLILWGYLSLGLSGGSFLTCERSSLFVLGSQHYSDGLRVWRILLIFRVVANGNGRIPPERKATVLRCGSRGPSLDGVWARTVGTEV